MPEQADVNGSALVTADGVAIKPGDTVFHSMVERFPSLMADTSLLTLDVPSDFDPGYFQRNTYSSPLKARVAAGRRMLKYITRELEALETEMAKES